MSTLSESARSAAKSKAERLVKADPRARVDASGYSPEGSELGDVQTGPRPISRRQFKRGGKVAGDAAPTRADRKPRASGGGLTATSLINRDVKAANDDRAGYKHDGGMKSGGRAAKFGGGPLVRPGMMPRGPGARPMPVRPMMRAEGGKVHVSGCGCAKCGGGRVGKASGGWTPKEIYYPKGGKPPAAAPGTRNWHIPQGGGSPKGYTDSEGKYTPIRKPRASGGAIYGGTRPVAGRLARKGGGRAKKGTNVNIIIAPQGGGQPRPPMAPPGAGPMPPPGGPVGLHQGAPPPAPMGPGVMPAGAPPPMRKAGGRILEKGGGKPLNPKGYPIDVGSGGGLGRLEKAKAARP